MTNDKKIFLVKGKFKNHIFWDFKEVKLSSSDIKILRYGVKRWMIDALKTGEENASKDAEEVLKKLEAIS